MIQAKSRMRRRRCVSRVGIFAVKVSVLCCLSVGAAHAEYVDPVDAPAIAALMPQDAPMLDVTGVGGNFVAVGARGVILVSKVTHVGSVAWTQAVVPVQTDLVDVQFINSLEGWASGHSGVILHTTDGGLHWTKQFDGWSANTSFVNFYNQQAAAGSKTAAANLRQVHLNFGNGPTLPWLGIWFTSAATGYAVGPFGDIAVTQDGGKTWLPWFEHIDDPNFLNLNSIREVGGTLYIVGEQGLVYKFNQGQQKFIQEPTNYTGSFFGITGTDEFLVAYGLRGTIYRSADQGKTWQAISDPSDSTIMNGTVLQDGEIVLVTVDGKLVTSRDTGNTFEVDPNVQNTQLTGVAVYEHGQVVLSGLKGVGCATVK